MTFSFIGYYWNLETLFGGFYKEVQLLRILDDAGPPLFGGKVVLFDLRREMDVRGVVREEGKIPGSQNQPW